MFAPSQTLTEVKAKADPDRFWAVGFPLLAVLLFLLSTHQGIGIWPDSARYMNMAATPWDAPAYAVILHLVALSGLDIVVGAWGIGLVFSGLNAFLTWHILRVATGRTAYAALGTALVVIAPQTVTLHGLAMSEPLFLTVIMATLLAFLRYVQSGETRWLIAVGVGIGLASLVRFTAPALGAAIALFLIIDPRHDAKRRVADVARIFIPSAVIFLGWAIIAAEVSGRSTGRPMEWLGNMTAREWWLSFNALAAWIAPDEVPTAIRRILFLLAMSASLLVLVRHARSVLDRAAKGHAEPSLIAIPLGFFFFTYLGFMVLATAIETNLHLNGRYAFPIYCTSIMAVTIAMAHVKIADPAIRWLHSALIGLACVMLVSHGVRSAVRVHQAWQEGVGFASLDWARSPTLAAVDRLPRDAILYSNGSDAIGYVLRRPARDIPAHIMLRTGREDPDFPYQAQLAGARTALARGNAYVVLLNNIDWRFYMASEQELIRQLNLVPFAKLQDGTIYQRAIKEERQQ